MIRVKIIPPEQVTMQVESLRGPQGEDGYTPTVDLERVDDGVLITVENKDGNKRAKVLDGKNGEDGEDGLDDIFIVHFNDYGNAAEEPIEEILAAIESGKAVIGVDTSGVIYEYSGLKSYLNKVSENAHTFQAQIDVFGGNSYGRFVQIKTDNNGFASGGYNVAARNPYKLILTGAVSATYDGSKQITVRIPEGGTGDGASLDVIGEEEVLDALAENDLMLAVGSGDGVLCDENGNVLEW